MPAPRKSPDTADIFVLFVEIFDVLVETNPETVVKSPVAALVCCVPSAQVSNAI